MSDTLQFQCQPGCTRCCRVRGYVYLTEGDLGRAAAFLAMTPEVFEARYVYRTKYVLRLRKPRNLQCHFLDAHGCKIHPVKPTQCRLYPFWPHLVEDRNAWQEEQSVCPGIGEGPLVQIGSALEIAEEMRTAYPRFY